MRKRVLAGFLAALMLLSVIPATDIHAETVSEISYEQTETETSDEQTETEISDEQTETENSDEQSSDEGSESKSTDEQTQTVTKARTLTSMLTSTDDETSTTMTLIESDGKKIADYAIDGYGIISIGRNVTYSSQIGSGVKGKGSMSPI